MTAARPKRKQLCAGLAGAAALMLTLAAGLPASRAAVTEQIVNDWHTGLAIDGYDPVAFFTDGKSIAGTADFEFRYGGVVWRFCNFGNRAAFMDRPDVYMPQYGGYDPLGVARGVAVAGNPTLWLIASQRLFLFYDTAWRDKFSADPDRRIAAADRKWPDVLHTLSP
jgi:YHS domain-containing protein